MHTLRKRGHATRCHTPGKLAVEIYSTSGDDGFYRTLDTVLFCSSQLGVHAETCNLEPDRFTDHAPGHTVMRRPIHSPHGDMNQMTAHFWAVILLFAATLFNLFMIATEEHWRDFVFFVFEFNYFWSGVGLPGCGSVVF